MSLSAYEKVERYTIHEGTDYGSVGSVIMRYQKARVVWRPGHSVFAGIGSRSYCEAALRVERIPSPHGGTFSEKLLSGGRLSNARWKEVRAKIANLLGIENADVPRDLPPKTITVPCNCAGRR